MASFLTLLLLVSVQYCLLITPTSSNQVARHYVVYTGSSSDGNRDASAHLELLSSVIPSHESERISLIHHYRHAFKGFSAMLTEKEASLLSGLDGVISVFHDPTLQLHTTRSWDFLQAESGTQFSHKHQQPVSSDVIVGIIDTGIWPESPSFDDKGIGQIPLRWKGVCMEGSDFGKLHCNRKLIGARYYNIPPTSSNNNKTNLPNISGSPRDFVGHGTHTSSIAAGTAIFNASYYGLALGTARGGSPSTRIAAYKACSQEGCSGSTILKAIDDAVNDGVDIISISIGMNSIFQSDYLNDPIAIGAFHAEQMGVLVVCSGGNDGPDPYTVVNSAPWIFTVAASNIDRAFQSTIILGNGKTFQGSAITFSNLTRSKTYPLAFGKDVAATFVPISEARNCHPGSLDPTKVVGRIVVCIDTDINISRKIKKLVVEDAKAKGLILINKYEKGVPFNSGEFPFAEVGNIAGSQILKYVNSNKKATATILQSVTVPRYKPAPAVAYFSSRGPGELTEDILKPDIMAPGVAIVAAMIPKPEVVLIGKKPSKFGILSGTSMACPHVAGTAAFIKSMHPQWSSSTIRSALMTTATIYNNIRQALTNSSGQLANPLETGFGEISPLKALNPGLVLETTTEDYLQFLCYYGYSEKTIRSMWNTKFSCPKTSYDSLISNINYPSISIGKLDRHREPYTINRTVTNVGFPNATYTSKVHAPVGLMVKVSPNKIIFTERITKLSFKVSFNGREARSGYNFGSITWSDGQHSVRVVFAVNVE